VLRDFKVVCIVDDKKFKAINNNEHAQRLNFGWLMLSQDDPKVEIDFRAFRDSDGFCSNCNVILGRVYLVSDKLFSHIVNDNLEVRTSVAINPATGAAEEGALYTYEAIPRATVMWFDVVYNKPEYFKINGADNIRHGKSNGNGWEWLEANVRKGLTYLKDLGVGGMNTRGMGRMKVLNIGG
jgi:CRISPR-associated protein Cmr4